MASFSRNLSYNYIGTLSISIAGFLTTPILIHIIGVDLFGAWALLSSLMVYSALFDFGIGLAGMKLVAEHSIETDLKKINVLFSNIAIAYFALSLIFLLIGLSFVPFIDNIFKVPANHEHQFIVAYIVFLIAATISFSGASFSGMLQGLHDFKTYNKAFIFQSLGTALLVLLLAYLTHNLIWLSVGVVTINILVWLLKAFFLYRKGLRLKFSTLSGAVIKRILKFSSAVFVITVAGRVIFDTDTVIIGIFSGTAAVAAYQVALNPNTALRKIGDQLNSVTLTSSSRLHAKKLQRELQQLFLNSTKYSLIIMLPFIVCTCFLAKDFLRTWVGADFESSASAMIALVFGISIVNLQATATQVILSLQKHHKLAVILSIEAVTNLALSIYLLHELGIIGVALGTTIPTALTAFLYTIPKASGYLGLPLISVLKSLWKPVVAAIGAIPLLILLKHAVLFKNLAQVLLAGALYAVVYGFLLICLDETVKQFMSKMVRSMRPA